MSNQYYIWKDEQEDGPFESEVMKSMYHEGEIQQGTLTRSGESEKWKPFSDFLDEIMVVHAPTISSEPNRVPPAPASPIDAATGGGLMVFLAVMGVIVLLVIPPTKGEVVSLHRMYIQMGGLVMCGFVFIGGLVQYWAAVIADRVGNSKK